jgi:predicted enzyme related to lactoylglutathione lyase
VFGCTKDAPHHVAVALSPAQAILLHAPTIDDVAHKVQGVGGVVFEKIVEQLGLAVSGAQVHI